MGQLHAGVERILCTTDYSHQSELALRHAIAFARAFDAELTLLHVVPLDTCGLETAVLPYLVPPPIDAQSLKAAYSDLRRFALPAIEAGCAPRMTVRHGDAWREIKAEALEGSADLIVVGTRGSSGLRRLLVGSVAEKLLRHAPCPVLTVCHEEGRIWAAPELIQNVLCAVDFTATSHAVIDLAFRLAGAKSARVTVLHVVEQAPATGDRSHAETPELGPVEDDPVPAAFERLRFLVPADVPIQVQTRVTTGVAHEEIIRVAVAERADIIVMGTRAYGPFGRAVLGSTCDHVVREATCPVLTVPPATHRIERMPPRPTDKALGLEVRER